MSTWRKVGCCLATVAGMMSANAFSDDWIEADGLVECIARGDGSRAYVFTNGTVTASVKTQLLATQYLVVGGGGGGGNTMGGGGGGGGVAHSTTSSIGLAAGDTFSATVGAGGTYGSSSGWSVKGTDGGDSSLALGGETITAEGGVGGDSWDTQPLRDRGGASGGTSSTSGATGQGYPGGAGVRDNSRGGGGGGGGASEPGGDTSIADTRAGKGGEGRSISITGTPVVYGSGGGGGGSGNGFGNYFSNVGGENAGDGTRNGNGGRGIDGTGGGGGGGGWNSAYLGGIGGCGTVIVVLEPPSENLEIETATVSSLLPDGATVNVKVRGIGAGATSVTVTYRYGVDPENLDRTLVVAEGQTQPGVLRATIADANLAFTWYLVAEVENDLREKVTSPRISFTTGGEYLRFTFMGGSPYCQLAELAFYDADTNRVNTGIVQTNNLTAAIDLNPGHWTMTKTLGTSAAEKPANLFDGDLTTKQCVTSNGDFPYSYTFRFEKGTRPALYNLATGKDYPSGRAPTAWTVELSRDGLVWEEVERRTGASAPGTDNTWYSRDEDGNSAPWPFSVGFEWARFVLGTVAPQEYRGAPVEPKVSVRSEQDGSILEEGVDYTLSYENNRGRGTATVVVTGINGFAGTHGSVDFEITTPSMAVTVATRAVLDADEPPYTTAVTVKDGETGATLVEGTDYVLVYSNNTAYGQAEVRVVGTNGYEFADAVAAKYAICGIVRVAPDAAAGGDGRSWSSPMRFMDALEACRVGGGAIWLKEGTYSDVSMSESLVVSNALVFVGGFAGTETSADQRPAGTVSTIDGGNARNLLRIENIADAALEFERIVFTRAHTRALYKSGAGDLTLSGCVFRANGLTVSGKPQSSADGRGVYAAGAGAAKVRIVDTEFSWQHASGYEWQGGGMGAYVTACASLTLDGCLFATNGVSLNTPAATYAGKFSGSALCVLSTPVFATDCRFAGNVSAICGGGDYYINGDGVAGKDGGCVFLDGTCGGSVFLNCAFVGNADWMTEGAQGGSSGSMSYGGTVTVHLKNAADTVEFRNCTIAYNLSQAKSSPAGLNVVRGTVTLRDSIVYGNIRGYNNTAVGADIDVKANGRLSVAYSLLTSTNATEISTASAGNLSVDSATVLTGEPSFVTPRSEVDALVLQNANFYHYFNTAATTVGKLGTLDVHLKSIGGYSVNGGGLGPSVTETSVMLDKGDPAASYASEREPNGNRVNAGAYGNTAEASMTPDGAVAIGTVGADTEADPGTAVFTIPLAGDETYLADVWFCFDYTVPSGDGTNGWAWVLDAGRMRLPGETLTVDLGRNGLYFSRNEKLRWRVVAKTAYGTASVDGETTIPYDQGAAVPAVADLSSPDYDSDVGTAIYGFRLGGVGRYEADVYICSGGTPGEGTNGWKEVNLVRTACARGDELTAPIGSYFDKDETCLWRIVVIVDGQVAAIQDGSATGIYDRPPIKGKHGPKYVVHLRAGAEGDASGRDWYNACATVADALTLLAADATKREIWIAGDLSASAGTTSVLLDRPCMIRGGFTTLEEQAPEDRAAGARSVIRNPSSSGRELVRTKTTASFGCDRIDFDSARGTAVYVDASGAGTALLFSDCDFLVSQLSVSGGGAATFAMTNCLFRNCTGTSAAFGISSLASATVADCRVETCGNSFTTAGGGGSRDFRDDVGFAVSVKSAPTVFTRCDFVGCRSTAHNSGEYHPCVLVAGASGGTEFRNCAFLANGCCTYETISFIDRYSAPLSVKLNSAAATVLLENCTFAYNFYNSKSGSAAFLIGAGHADVRNSIFFGNFHTDTSAGAIRAIGTSTVDVSYTLFEGTTSEYLLADSTASINLGKGVLTGDPEFFTPLDYARAHMIGVTNGMTMVSKSIGNHLTNREDCVSMDLHLSGTYRGADGVAHRSGGLQSPAVNAGDKASAYDREPQPNGGRVNLGNYGNTPEATMSKIGTVLIVR